MKPKQVTPMIPSRTSREPAQLQADRQHRATPATEPASPDEESAIREKALEILRREFPLTSAAESVSVDSHSSSLQDEATRENDPEAPPDLPLPASTSQAPPSAFPVPPSAFKDPIPARMLNEFVYCPRLFYYEFVEGVFVASADTLRGAAIHQRVDSGTGALPRSNRKSEAMAKDAQSPTVPQENDGAAPIANRNSEIANETIHSRSVQMGSDLLGVVAKMDLVEVRTGLAGDGASANREGDLLAALEVCPVDYKAGAPKPGENATELWDTDRMQLGLQALILRDNGYTCTEGIIYYRATKQRVRLPITPELESWILRQITEAKRLIAASMPPPLVHSPKCVRCSLAPVCLPDETRLLAETPHLASGHPLPSPTTNGCARSSRLAATSATTSSSRFSSAT